MSPEHWFLGIVIFVPVILAACCICLASRVDAGRSAPKGARLR